MRKEPRPPSQCLPGIKVPAGHIKIPVVVLISFEVDGDVGILFGPSYNDQTRGKLVDILRYPDVGHITVEQEPGPCIIPSLPVDVDEHVRDRHAVNFEAEINFCIELCSNVVQPLFRSLFVEFQRHHIRSICVDSDLETGSVYAVFHILRT